MDCIDRFKFAADLYSLIISSLHSHKAMQKGDFYINKIEM